MSATVEAPPAAAPAAVNAAPAAPRAAPVAAAVPRWPRQGRTLIVTDRADFFMAKLLRSVVMDEYEPLPVDVLRYGPAPSTAHPQAFSDQVAMRPWPAGVREFSAHDLHHAVAPTGQSLDSLLDGAARVAVYSVNPGNADLINHLVERWPQLPLSVICSDDEIERHWNYQRRMADAPQQQAQWRQAFLYPESVERAFEGVKRWFIGRMPWEQMLRTGRRSDLTLIPWVPPILNRMPGLADVTRPADRLRIVLFPKPSVTREAFVQAARTLTAALPGQRLEIVSFRNDLPTLSQIEGAWVRCWPYPVDEVQYHRVVAGAHAMVAVPRGGLSTLRDAVRYGLDLVSLYPNTPNELSLQADMGLTLTPPEGLRASPDDDALQRRQRNRARLAAYEFAAVAAFRQEYCPV